MKKSGKKDNLKENKFGVNLGVKLKCSISIVVLTTLLSNSSVNATTIDDFRELMGEDRLGDRYTEEQQNYIISQYNSIVKHNTLANLVNSYDPTSDNKELNKRREELEQSIRVESSELVKVFESGESVDEILKIKATISNLKFIQSQLQEEKEKVTIEVMKNDMVEEYKNVVAIVKEVSNYKEVGIIGNLLLSPLQDSFVLTSPYGYRVHPTSGGYEMHKGVDLKASLGDKVYTTWKGTVTATYESEKGGKTIEVTHDKGLKTRYLHLNDILVSTGQQVNQHDLIGTVGNTGEVTGAHLHYEIIVDDKPVNPVYFFGNKGAKALNNFIMVSEDPIVREMSKIVTNIKLAPKSILEEMKNAKKSNVPGEKKEVNYEREGVVPKDSVEVHLKKGHSMPKPSDEME